MARCRVVLAQVAFALWWSFRSRHLVSWLTLLAVVIYATITYGLLRETTKANSIAEQQLRVSNRPWIEPHITISKPLTFYDDYAEIVLDIRSRNGGRAPAIGSEPILTLVLIDAATHQGQVLSTEPKNNPVLKAQETWCNPEIVNARFKSRKATGSRGRLLLPNSEVTYPRWGLQTARPKGDVLAAWITGCIAYVDEFGAGHATLLTLVFATSYPFKPGSGLIVNAGVWGLAPYGQNAY